MHGENSENSGKYSICLAFPQRINIPNLIQSWPAQCSFAREVRHGISSRLNNLNYKVVNVREKVKRKKTDKKVYGKKTGEEEGGFVVIDSNRKVRKNRIMGGINVTRKLTTYNW